MRTYSRLAVLALCFALISCSDNQIIVTLEAAVTASEVALPVIAAAAGVDPQLVRMLEGYLSAVAGSAGQAAEILSNQHLTPAQRSAEITALFAAAVVPNLPAGTPANVANAISVVSSAVSQFLAQIRTTEAQLAHSPVSAGFFDERKKPDLPADKLARIRERARKAKAKIEAARKK